MKLPYSHWIWWLVSSTVFIHYEVCFVFEEKVHPAGMYPRVYWV